MFIVTSAIRDFLGYGNVRSKIWFIGLEEGFQSPYVKLNHPDFDKYLKMQHQKRLQFDVTMDLDRTMVQMEGWVNFE